MRSTCVLLLCLALPSSLLAAPALQAFDFGPNGNAASHPLFDASRGFGFEGDAPAKFSVRAPEGNYRVSVGLNPSRKPAVLTLLAEQRRLMIERMASDRGRVAERSFVVNVRAPALDAPPPNAPGGSAVRLKAREVGSLDWDDKLTIEFEGDMTQLRKLSIEAVDVPTLYLAGDSTVTDQAAAPNASWGQMLPRFFKPDVAVANHAESGETLKSFLTELRFDKLLSALRAGDWVMIQFGHNDQKTQWPQTYADAATTYRAYLRSYIEEVRRRGATAILVTSPERRNFDAQGHIVPSLGEYPEAVRAVARAESVALIDLNAASIQFYEALGPDVSPRAFADEGRDHTHHNEYGAYSLARMVVAGLRAADPKLTAGLAAHLAADAGRFDPSHPDLPASEATR